MENARRLVYNTRYGKSTYAMTREGEASFLEGEFNKTILIEFNILIMKTCYILLFYRIQKVYNGTLRCIIKNRNQIYEVNLIKVICGVGFI